MSLLRYLFALSLIATTSNCYALFDVQVLAGYRSTTYKLDIPDGGIDDISLDASAPIGAAAAHFNIPLIPIALGVSYNYVSLSTESNRLNIDKITGSELGAELYAWLPFGKFQPYVKLGYVFMGDYNIPLNNVDLDYKAEGFYWFVGLKYSLIPTLRLLLEGGMPATGTKDGSISNNALDIDNDFLKISAWSIRLGLEFGI